MIKFVLPKDAKMSKSECQEKKNGAETKKMEDDSNNSSDEGVHEQEE